MKLSRIIDRLSLFSARRVLLCVTSIAFAGGVPDLLDAAEPPSITVPNVFLRLSEDIDLPAREAGVLAEIPVQEGQLVEAGQVVARVEDSEARLLRDRANVEVDIARREADRSIEIEYARKALEVAQAELSRAERSRAAVAGAVSLTEVDRLRLVTEKADAEIRRIEQEQTTAKLTTSLKESEAALAELRLKRHSIVASKTGQIVEHYRHPGEWVEPGEPVVRLIRLDVLRAEGYLDAAAASRKFVGATVRLSLDTNEGGTAEFDGNVTFVAPEVEPTTGQILIRAEIENRDFVLHPGLRGRMTIVRHAGDGIDLKPERGPQP